MAKKRRLSTTIFDSDGFDIRLTNEEYDQYRKELIALQNKWMLIEQLRRGLWAQNQQRYVQKLSDLNQYDWKPRVIHPKFKGT